MTRYPMRVVRSLALLGCALVVACAQQPARPPIPAREAAAIDANHRAENYFRRGDFENAVLHYRDALRIAQSLEDTDAIAANSVNLSIAYQRLGKSTEARASLAPVLESGTLAFPPTRLAQAALRRAILDFDERRSASAVEWADKAAAYCGACPQLAAIHNVKGQLALETGRNEDAAASAQAALAVSRATDNRTEVANALRLLGTIALRGGDGAAARTALSEALAIDRQLALPRKIYLDLVGLGRASALAGERAEALVYYQRALAVSEADRDAQGAAEARALINAPGK